MSRRYDSGVPYSQGSPGAAGAKRVRSSRSRRSSRSAWGTSTENGRCSRVVVLMVPPSSCGASCPALVNDTTEGSGTVPSFILSGFDELPTSSPEVPMASTSARMLALLGLLQSRPDWSGAELAARLGVSDRTVRNDVARLRELGYPVGAVRGPGGRYRLGAGARLPPLLLDDAEAVAVAVG